jgi:hypothetical protein
LSGRNSQAGFEGLKNILKSDARHHVVSFTYAVPELLKTGKYFLWYDVFALTPLESPMDILNFDIFKTHILTPNSYVEEAKIWYDAGEGADVLLSRNMPCVNC